MWVGATREFGFLSHVTRIRQPKSEYSREAKWQGEAPPGRAWLLVTTAERYSRYIPGFLVRGGVLTLCGFRGGSLPCVKKASFADL